jgi:[ribosomal protein S5]-alanine N-acetyltransferase
MKIHSSFETERLILKPTAIEDHEFFLELLNTPKWIKFVGDRNVKSIEQAKEYIRNRILPQFEKFGYSNYTVIRKLDNAKIGSCGLFDREGLDGVDIGFAFLPEYEKKGYGFEAAERMKKAAFEEFNISQILAITMKTNLASQRILDKLGMTFEKIVKLPNDDEELLLYSIIN